MLCRIKVGVPLLTPRLLARPADLRGRLLLWGLLSALLMALSSFGPVAHRLDAHP